MRSSMQRTVPRQPAAAAADQRVRCLIEVIVIVVERADVHQSLGRNFDRLGEEPEVLHAGDDGLELLPDPRRHVGEELDLHQLALGLLGATLGPRTVLPRRDQLDFAGERRFAVLGDQPLVHLSGRSVARAMGDFPDRLSLGRELPVGCSRRTAQRLSPPSDDRQSPCRDHLAQAA